VTKKEPYKIILSGGGTGGHIYPAIAIANELKSRFPDAEFLFVGALDRMEMEKVPQAGYKIEGLWISGIERKLTLKNMAFPAYSPKPFGVKIPAVKAPKTCLLASPTEIGLIKVTKFCHFKISK